MLSQREQQEISLRCSLSCFGEARGSWSEGAFGSRGSSTARGRLKKGRVQNMPGLLFADLEHYSYCSQRGCGRCSFVRNVCAWHKALPLGSQGRSWLLSTLDDNGAWKLRCSVCQQTGQQNELAEPGVAHPLLGNLKRHHASEQRAAALVAAGYASSSGEDKSLAPPLHAFELVFEDRKKGGSFNKGVKGVGGRHKVTDMVFALGQAVTEIDRAFLRGAETIAIYQDERQHHLLLRFRAANAELQCRNGILGYQSVGPAVAVLQWPRSWTR